MTTEKMIEEAVRRFNEKFLPKQDRLPYYVSLGDARDFLVEELTTIATKAAGAERETVDPTYVNQYAAKIGKK